MIDVKALREALRLIWMDYEYIGLRMQRGAEKRTRIGAMLRPSHEWVDERKLRRKMRGTAGFQIYSLDKIDRVLDAMQRHGYNPDSENERLVVIGTNDGAWGEDMPEKYATAFIGAQLLAIVEKDRKQ